MQFVKMVGAYLSKILDWKKNVSYFHAIGQIRKKTTSPNLVFISSTVNFKNEKSKLKYCYNQYLFKVAFCSVKESRELRTTKYC